MNTTNLSLTPIGQITANDQGWLIELSPAFRAGLDGLDGFSHVQVLFWCHHVDTPALRQVLSSPQPYKHAPDQLGTFATRSPVRPNPIALTPAKILALDVERGVIHVEYLDAEDGSPVLDLKPYQPCLDRVREVRAPTWCAHWPEFMEDSATFDWASEFVHAR